MKLKTAADAVSVITDGMTIGIGGWGSRRKPMALVDALIAQGTRDLTVVSYGGPDVGMLCAAGAVRKLVYGFVSLDTIPLEPNFRKARQAGSVEVMELDEGMMRLGLQAAAWNLPYLPTPVGLGSDILRTNPGLKTVRCPYTDQELVAMPALSLDVSLVHMNRADARGNGQYLGPDPYFDDLFAAAAQTTVMSCESLGLEPEPMRILVERLFVSSVVVAPGGAGFTDCSPDYPRDEAAQKTYAKGAK